MKFTSFFSLLQNKEKLRKEKQKNAVFGNHSKFSLFLEIIRQRFILC